MSPSSQSKTSPPSRSYPGRWKKYYDPEYQRQWQNRNPKRRATQLKIKFGISLEDYEDLFKKQKGLCAICKEPPPERRALAVDHNHETGEIRGLLCTRCNIALGAFKDNPALLRRAIKYVS